MHIKIVFVLIFIKACFSQVPMTSRGFASVAPDVVPNNKHHWEENSRAGAQKNTPGFHIRLPFMDMEIQNERNLFVIQERVQQEEIFILHGGDLYQLFVDRNEKRLSLVGYLGGALKDVELLGGEIIIWHDFYILVIAMDDYLEIYQLSKHLLELRAEITVDSKRRNETAPTLESIQQLSLPGRYRQHFLVDANEEHIMLIVGINFTKLHSRLHTFLWSSSYFEPIEELTVPPLHMLHIMGTYPKYLIRGRIINHQAKTIISVYKIEFPAMTLQTTQTFTANSRIIHASSFKNRNYLIACTMQQKQCTAFRMSSDGLFSVYLQRSGKDLAFDKFVGAKNFLVAARQNQVFVYTNGRLDCYARFVTNETDVTSIQTLVNRHGENFILLNYKRAFNTLVRFVDVESDTGDLLGAAAQNATEFEDTNPLIRHRHVFEETIGMLRSLLLRRRNTMNTFRKISAIRKIHAELQVPHPVRIHAGNINAVRVVGENLLSPLQLLQRVEGMRKKFGLRRGKRETFKGDATNSTFINNNLKVKHLKVRNLIYEDSILNGFHLDKTSQPMPILSVRPKLITKTLTTNKLFARQNLKHLRLGEKVEDNSTLPVKKFRVLNVESINNVTWKEFYDSLFLKNRDTKLTGNLTLKASTEIFNLSTSAVNKIVVENLFNLERPQVVHSNILFSGFLVKNLHAETINGLDFANDIVFQNTDDIIESPVNMYRLSIAKDLLLDENVTVVRASNGEGNDFQQYYTGRVVINGSLTVKNLVTEDAERVMINGMPFSETDVKEKYFLRNESQQFNSTVMFGNAKVTVPGLSTNFLNGYPTEEHLMANEPVTPVKEPLLLVFMNAHILGDLSSDTITTRIANLSRNAVRRGDVANITGLKTFKAPLTVEHVMTLSMNQLPVTELVLKSQLRKGFKFKGKKFFNSISVDGETHVHKTLNVTNLNKLPMDELFNNDYYIEKLKVPFKLEAKNIVFHKINDICFDEVFNNFKLRDGHLVLHKELIIDGNVSFGEDLNVENINGIDWNAYQADLVRRNDNEIVTGKKRFLEELTITKALKTPTLNEFNMEEIFEKILSKSRPQLIAGAYTFDKLVLSNLDAAVINDIPTTEFIDLRTEKLIIENDIVIPKVTIFGDIFTDESNQVLRLSSYAEQLKQMPNRFWRNIVVTKNAFWQETADIGKRQRELLSYLHRYAVQRYGQQIITGNVKLRRPLIKNIKTKRIFAGDLNFDFLAKDCIFKSSNKTQLITAGKTFLSRVHILDVEAKSYVDSKLVNGINVLKFNSSLYYVSSDDPIIEPIHFLSQPKIERLFIEGLINGMNPLVIYHNATQKVPPLKLRHLIVLDTLQVGDINGKSLNYVLANRIKKASLDSQEIFGTLNFENLMLNKSFMLQTINGLPIDKLVFKQSKQLQTISGIKTIEKDLILAGPVHVLRLNGEDLIENYQQSIFINRNYYHDRLRIDSATFEKGLIFTKPAYPLLASIMEDTVSTDIGRRFKIIENELQEIERTLSTKSRSSKNLLYLDYALNWDILRQAPTDNVTVYKSFTYELKKSSLCERQYLTVRITHENFKTGAIFLSNSTANFITKTAFGLSVEAENFCHHSYRKVKSKITITFANYTRVIGMKKYIEHIMIFSPNSQVEVFLLLHAIDLSRNQHEVRILRILKSQQSNITDWQSLTLGIGKTLRLYEYSNHSVLISGGGMLKNHPALAIYHFDMQTQKFVLSQTIDGDFDIHELVPTTSEGDFQLILSCRQCQRVHIYAYNPTRIEAPYQIFQILKLKTLIDKVQPFRMTDGSIYLLFLAENGQHYYYLYRYSQLQGWLHMTYGYFENTEMAFPLTGDVLKLEVPNLLALLCGVNNCSLVRAVVV